MYLQRFLRNATLALTLLLLASVVALPQGSGQANVLTNKMDNSRSGLNPNEVKLTRTNVTYNLFGKLFAFNVDGYIQAQPLYMSNLVINGGTHNVVFIATQNNSIYAIDADTGSQLWFRNLGAAVPNNAEGCNNITGFNGVGILGTPVIDPTTNTMYLTAKTFNSVTHVATHSLHAVDVTTGLEQTGSPVDISATIGNLTFNGLPQLQRAGLLLSNGTIYIAFGSNGCDFNARGWLFAYSASSLQQLAVMITQPDNSYGSSIWQSGVGPAADSSGNVYLATANGLFQYSTMDLGDSVLKISLVGSQFVVDDYFTPFDQANMQTNDLDLGSSGVTLLPTQSGSSTPNLLVASGKDADIYLINTDSLGQYNPSGNTQIPQYIPNALGGEFFGNAMSWNNTIYFLARQDYLRSYTLSVNGSGNSVLTAGAQTALKLTNFGEPVISSNGNTNGIVWLVRNIKGVPLLSAYDATALYLIYDSGQASGGRDTLGIIGHFSNPIIANGKVYAGTQTQLVAYGLFPEVNPTIGGNQSGTVGTTLPLPIGIIAFNPYTGQTISGVSVTFSDGGKGGAFGNGGTGVTDSTGRASTSYTLPTLAGTYTLTATSPGYSTASFTETAVAGAVTSMALVSGGKQTGTVGTTLLNPIVMRAKDTYGNVVPNVSVTFTDNASPTGSFSPNPAITDSTGQATTSYTLPTVAKNLTITGTVGSVTAKASEQSLAGPPNAINIVQGNNQTAGTNTQLPKALGIAVVDQYQNGVPGVTVTFSDNGAGGTFSPVSGSVTTNSTGQASVTYTTGPNPGAVTITCTYTSGSTTLQTTFNETVN